MIKTHIETGLKYLCMTRRSDPYKYTGSGKHWRRHLRKHGRKLETEILFQSESQEEFSANCLYYSELYDIVSSKSWANCIPETGMDGGTTHRDPYWLRGFKHSEETKKVISESGKGRPGARSFLGKKHSDETKKKMSDNRIGMKFSDEHRKNISKAQLGKQRNWSDDTRENHSKSMSKMLSKRYRCLVCNKSGNSGHIARYHKECMEIVGWQKIECQ